MPLNRVCNKSQCISCILCHVWHFVFLTFFFFCWVHGTFCNVEVMRNKELIWNSLTFEVKTCLVSSHTNSSTVGSPQTRKCLLGSFPSVLLWMSYFKRKISNLDKFLKVSSEMACYWLVGKRAFTPDTGFKLIVLNTKIKLNSSVD